MPCSRDSCQSRSWPRPWSDATRHAPHLRPVHGWRCAAASGAAGCRAARPDERVRQAQHRQAQRDDRGFRGHDGGQPQDAARLRNVRMHLEGLRLAHMACRLCGHAMGFFGGVFCVCVCGGRKGIKGGGPTTVLCSRLVHLSPVSAPARSCKPESLALPTSQAVLQRVCGADVASVGPGGARHASVLHLPGPGCWGSAAAPASGVGHAAGRRAARHAAPCSAVPRHAAPRRTGPRCDAVPAAAVDRAVEARQLALAVVEPGLDPGTQQRPNRDRRMILGKGDGAGEPRRIVLPAASPRRPEDDHVVVGACHRCKVVGGGTPFFSPL